MSPFKIWNNSTFPSKREKGKNTSRKKSWKQIYFVPFAKFVLWHLLIFPKVSRRFFFAVLSCQACCLGQREEQKKVCCTEAPFFGKCRNARFPTFSSDFFLHEKLQQKKLSCVTTTTASISITKGMRERGKKKIIFTFHQTGK